MRNRLLVVVTVSLLAAAFATPGCDKPKSGESGAAEGEPGAKAPEPAGPPEAREPGGTWQVSTPMPFALANARLVELGDRRLFVYGSTSERRGLIYDPKTHTWHETAPSGLPRGDCALSVLRDGRVLVTGGVNGEKQFYVLQGATIYDPKTNTWSEAASMKEQRHGHTQFVLDDGRVIVFGGRPGGFAPPIRLVETYDPAKDKWSTKGSLAAGRAFHAATRLDGKRFLLVGGQAKEGALASAEICTLGEARCEILPLPAKRDATGLALLPDGKVLLVDGQDPSSRTPPVVAYDPATGRFDPTHRPVINRNLHGTTVMADGRVLVTGGAGGPMTQQAEIFDPKVSLWVKAGQASVQRHGHLTHRLDDGSIVLIAGLSGEGSPVVAVDRFVLSK